MPALKPISIFKYAVAIGLSGLVPLLLLPFLTAKLTPTDFGYLSAFIIYANILTTFCLFSTNGYVSVKYHKLGHESFSQGFSLVHFIFLISWVLFNLIFYFLEMFGLLSSGENFVLFYPLISLFLGLHIIYQAFFQTSEQVNNFFFSKLIVVFFDICLCLILLKFFSSLENISRSISWSFGLFASIVFG